ncbi:MAG: DUF3570 domain-containing protein [Flavobacteriales bacterium]|nr:DUF3570 domain-containing protein [Flavobacteriales bacterium]
MQLTNRFFTILLGLIATSFPAFSQQSATATKPKSDSVKAFPIVNADFLFSYYEQDGDHGAVTGGKGTQLLWDYAGKTVISVQLDSHNVVGVTAGVDQYSSASTDNIDLNVSSASASDVRAYSNLNYTRKRNKQKSWTIGSGFSVEYDVTSVSANVGYNQLAKDENSGFGISGMYYNDNWSLIYPYEFRYRGPNPSPLLSTNVRNLVGVNANYFRIINKRLQIGLYADFIQQWGLLSTPFHRVYFTDGSSDIERLPDKRWKVPLAARTSYFATDWLVLKWFNRYYMDGFGIQAFTSNLDASFKVKRYWVITPSYRYHSQSAADYFQPFMGHATSAQFYTSDYDLAGLSSQKIGMALAYHPLYGRIPVRLRSMNRLIRLRSLDFRSGLFIRSDGLRANYFSFGASFSY